MAVETFQYTTGPATLQDVGTLAYNGCTFSPLVVTSLSGKIVKDNAGRTTKLMEYKLSVDGFVTLVESALSIAPSINTMRRLLTEQGRALTYSGRGFELLPANLEVAWGPIPDLIEFQPLGGGRSAKVKWEIVFRTCEITQGNHFPGNTRVVGNADLNNVRQFPLLQFNYETSLTYNEDYYSSMSIKGTMEILMNRKLNTATDGRTLTATVDDLRTELDKRIFSSIDLSRFYVTRRNYNVSRDKRIMEFDILVEEKPYMDMPPDCTVARGSYNVRPAKAGPGLVLWMCTLRASYTVRADKPRRVAWFSFLRLLQLRMSSHQNANIPTEQSNQAQQQNPINLQWTDVLAAGLNIRTPNNMALARAGVRSLTGGDVVASLQQQNNEILRRNPTAPGAWLIDFSFEEGLYKESKSITFSATWRMVTTLSHILLASGIWRKVAEVDKTRENELGGNLWALSMQDVSGALSVLPNYLDPSKDTIIDFGY